MILDQVCGVVCHDAGGAEILSSYIRRENLRCSFSISGPAIKVFEKKIGPINNIELSALISASSWVLCGTSWQSSLEIEAIKIAKSMGKKVCAYLDHWVNYESRFERSGVISLPDEIWVADQLAYKLAKEAFSSTAIILKYNPYLLDIVDEFKSLKVASIKNLNAENEILYLTEPTREHALKVFGNERKFGYTEEDMLQFFLENVKNIFPNLIKIKIRPHPSESDEKYSWVRERYDLPISIGGERTLIQEIYDSDLVVGCASMAMIVANACGKRVVSCLPRVLLEEKIPSSKIEIMQELINEKN